MTENKKNEMEELLNQQETGIVREFIDFLMTNKAYWIAPIVLVMILLIGLVAISYMTGGAAAPFIYTLF